MEIEGKIIEIKLEFLKTKGYFLDHIISGGFLGKTLLDNIEFQNGKFFIFLPELAKLERLYDFSEGGVNPTTSTNEIHYVEGVGDFIPEIQKVTSLEVSQFIKKFLELNNDHFAICEDVAQTPQDPPIEFPNVNSHSFNDHIYYSLHKKNSLTEINTVLRKTDYIWYSLAVLSKSVKLPHLLHKSNFSSISSNALYVITSAHDGENFIVWKRN